MIRILLAVLLLLPLFAEARKKHMFEQPNIEFVPVCQRSASILSFLESLTGLPCAQIRPEHLADKKISTSFSTDMAPLRDGDFTGLDGMTRILFTSKTLKEIRPEHLLGLTGLKYLEISDTGITDLPPGLLRFVPTVEEVFIANNSIPVLRTGVFDGGSDLQFLTYKNNGTSVIETGAIRKLHDLKEIKLEGPLGTFRPGALSDLKSLKDLAINGAGLTDLDYRGFVNLNFVFRLSLENNSLTDLPVDLQKAFPSVVNLDLSGNPLIPRAGMFESLPQLISLWLNRCGFVTLPTGLFRGMAALENLNLEQNNISEIDPEVFADAAGITFLALSDNMFTELRPGMFRHIEQLRSLFIGTPTLEKIPDSFFTHFKKPVNLVSVSGAPLTLTSPAAFQNVIEINRPPLRLGVEGGAQEWSF